MYELDGYDISDTNYDKICLNCQFWESNVQLYGAAQGVMCTRGMGQTGPNDSYSMFLPNTSASEQDLNRYFEKQQNLHVWKRSRD